jgi:hypothetical protein
MFIESLGDKKNRMKSMLRKNLQIERGNLPLSTAKEDYVSTYNDGTGFSARFVSNNLHRLSRCQVPRVDFSLRLNSDDQIYSPFV